MTSSSVRILYSDDTEEELDEDILVIRAEEESEPEELTENGRFFS